MKAQAAIFECFLSILILYSAISISGYEAFTSASLLNQRRAELWSAVYDFQDFTYKNSDIGSCAYLSTSCAEVLRAFAQAYALSYANFSYDGLEYSYGNASECGNRIEFCAPIETNVGYSIGCENFCGG
jgi:hypothetical protein